MKTFDHYNDIKAKWVLESTRRSMRLQLTAVNRTMMCFFMADRSSSKTSSEAHQYFKSLISVH